jgi:uracil-DNA glycosylase
MTAGFDLAALAASDRIDSGWAEALAPARGPLDAIGQVLDADREAGVQVLPAEENILRAFQAPLDEVRVLIVGQDPYPTPGHSIGLAFAVEPHVRPLPRSLANIFRELADDLGTPPPASGDLTPWTANGVLLLNRVLTVRAGDSGSHRGIGWEAVTDTAIRALVDRGRPLVAILWGRDAQALTPMLGDTPIVASAHPSPLSASRGFFGSRPFSRANALLQSQGAEPVDWSLNSAGLW